VDSYLGTRFPASDIPKQARELYTRKLLALIPNVTYSPVPLLALEEGPSLDMTYSVLRSVSPSPRIPPKHGRDGNTYPLAGDRR
jgi:two-component system, chemotaxis family, sensor kinase Cph1